MTFPQVPYLDFCLLAIILVLLGGFSFLEVLIPTALERHPDQAKLIRLQKAASWSIVGAIVTLMFGALIQIFPWRHADLFALAVPLGFLVMWGSLHMYGTSAMNFEYLEGEADLVYRTLIENVVRDNAREELPTSEEQVFRDCCLYLIKYPPWWAITTVYRQGGSLVSKEGIENLFGKLSFTKWKFDAIVASMEKKKQLRRGTSNELLPYSALALPPHHRA